MLGSPTTPNSCNHPRPSCVSVPFCTLFPVLRMPFPHSPSPFAPGLPYRMDFWTRNLGTDGCPALPGSLHSCPLREKLAGVLLVSGFLEHPAVGNDEFSRSSHCRQAGQLSALPQASLPWQNTAQAQAGFFPLSCLPGSVVPRPQGAAPQGPSQGENVSSEPSTCNGETCRKDSLVLFSTWKHH